MSTLLYSLPSLFVFAFSIYAFELSRKELQFKAAKRFLLIGLSIAIGLLSLLLLPKDFAAFFGMVLIVVSGISIIFFSIDVPSRKLHFRYNREFKGRIDERETMFSRAELKKGDAHFDAYYQQHPEHYPSDEAFRANPGLACEGSYFYHKELFQATHTTFELVDDLHKYVDGKVHEEKLNFSAPPTDFYTKLGKELGAYTIGICELKPEHFYHTGGRKERYNKSYHPDHTHAIVFTVEMNHEMMMYAPKAPTLLESANQYLLSGRIAVSLAEHIRSMGYEARAHIDGNYEVVAPLIARDAGLGELGRMGLLMTPEVGPRVRLGVVTTKLALIPTEAKEELSMLDFCLQCKKCAHNCPSQAISFEAPEEVNGVYRWQISQEACFEYWTKAGTDCGRCVIVCPYSHPNNFLHNVVRKGISNSSAFRRFALVADDFFYGKKPKPLSMNYFTQKKD